MFTDPLRIEERTSQRISFAVLPPDDSLRPSHPLRPLENVPLSVGSTIGRCALSYPNPNQRQWPVLHVRKEKYDFRSCFNCEHTFRI